MTRFDSGKCYFASDDSCVFNQNNNFSNVLFCFDFFIISLQKAFKAV